MTMNTFFQNFHESFIAELEYDRDYLDNLLATWVQTYGSEDASIFEFYKTFLELGESHFLAKGFDEFKQNRGLRNIYSLMFQLFVEADWDRTPVTKKLNNLNIVEATGHGFKVKMEIIPPGRCQYSEQFRNQSYDLELAMKHFPLDYTKCQREGGCVCTVGFEGVRDGNGRLIRVK